jgi:sterol desaturase/sphingolipid hydroxylase (fatty acid hydroxylase superfamily)
MGHNIIPYLVPFFILGIVVEAAIARRRGVRAYHLHAMVSDLGAGVISQVAEVFLKVGVVLVYAWVYDHASFVVFADDSPWPWVIAFFGIDFAFYWWHRTSHVVNVLWGVHVVHHHSEDFNLSVALRQPAFELVTSLPFYLPLALFGVPAHVWLVMYALNLFYQFWTHTELVRSLGLLERVLNTPSHHRVHHGINPEYLDKNYGGIFIVWDRLFGTWAPEGRRVVFGVTKPLRSFNPLWANFEYYVGLVRIGRGFARWRDRVRLWWSHPGWRPDGPADAPADVDAATFRKHDPATSPKYRAYIAGHFVLAFALSGIYMSSAEGVAPLAMIPGGIVVVLSLVALAGVVENQRWARVLDAVRQTATVGLVAWYGQSLEPPELGLVLGFALATAFFLLRARLGARMSPTVNTRA